MILESQKIDYNPETKTVFTTIREPFFAAGKILGWKNPSAGMGFNESVIDFILKRKAKLVMKIENYGIYWTDSYSIQNFINENNCDYQVSGKNLKVLSWKIFTKIINHQSI